MNTVIIISLLTLLYIFVLNKTHGSRHEKTIFILLRCLVFIGVCLLLISPRFEIMHREWKYPVFHVLEDDSPSVSLQKQTPPELPFLAQIADKAKIIRRTFSENSIENRFSIAAQIKHCLSKEPTAILLLSDGNESTALSVETGETPIFTIGLGLETFPDTQLSIEHYPELFFLHQSHSFSGHIRKNFPAESAGILQFKLNNELVQELALSLKQELTPWKIDYTINTAGLNEFSFIFNPEKSEQITENNHSNFYVNVSDRKKNIVFIARYPSTDLSFYLRTLRLEQSLQTKTIYTDAPLKNLELKATEADLLVFYNLPYNLAKNFSDKFPQLPRIYVFGQEGDTLLSWRDSQLLPISDKPRPFRQTPRPEYSLDPDKTGFFRFFEHESYEKSVLNMLPALQTPLNLFSPTIQDKNLFSMRSGKDELGIIFANTDKKPPYAIINSTDLYTFPFSPFSTAEKKALYNNLLLTIFSLLLNHEEMQGLSLHSTGSFVEYGQDWKATIQSRKPLELSFYPVPNGDKIYLGKSPADLQLQLKPGNYRLDIGTNKNPLQSLPVHCAYPTKEFIQTGINQDKLLEIAEKSNGRLYKPETMKKLNDFIPAKLFEKRLEIHKTPVDLQKNLAMLLALFSLICLEWLYRYIKKLV